MSFRSPGELIEYEMTIGPDRIHSGSGMPQTHRQLREAWAHDGARASSPASLLDELACTQACQLAYRPDIVLAEKRYRVQKMPRTVINLDDESKAWLDRQAASLGVPMTELVRQAVRDFRAKEQRAAPPSMQEILQRTSGIWRGGDGLEYQQRLRNGWS